MSNVQTTRDAARPQDSPFRSGIDSELKTIKNWHWHDPPILFPIFLLLLVIAYALLRASQ